VRDIFGIPHSIAPSEEDDALGEAEDAVNSVAESGEMVELPPRNAYVRRLQHQVIEAAGLLSESVGVEPRRRLRVYRNREKDA
jgi:predicted RNA-binding protein Jag